MIERHRADLKSKLLAFRALEAMAAKAEAETGAPSIHSMELLS